MNCKHIKIKISNGHRICKDCKIDLGKQPEVRAMDYQIGNKIKTDTPYYGILDGWIRKILPDRLEITLNEDLKGIGFVVLYEDLNIIE